MPETHPTRSDSQGWITRAFASGVIGAVAKHVTLTYVIPFGLSVVTGLSGLAQGLPWMYVLLGSGVMFAAVTTGLLRFDDWRERRRVNGKLHLVAVNAGPSLTEPGISIGVLLKSDAWVPLEVDFAEFRTRLNQRVPAKTSYIRTRFTIPPQQAIRFDDHMIDVGNPPPQGALEGFIEAKVKYGRPGNLKYELIIKRQITVEITAERVIGRVTANMVAES